MRCHALLGACLYVGQLQRCRRHGPSRHVASIPPNVVRGHVPTNSPRNALPLVHVPQPVLTPCRILPYPAVQVPAGPRSHAVRALVPEPRGVQREVHPGIRALGHRAKVRACPYHYLSAFTPPSPLLEPHANLAHPLAHVHVRVRATKLPHTRRSTAHSQQPPCSRPPPFSSPPQDVESAVRRAVSRLWVQQVSTWVPGFRLLPGCGAGDREQLQFLGRHWRGRPPNARRQRVMPTAAAWSVLGSTARRYSVVAVACPALHLPDHLSLFHSHFFAHPLCLPFQDRAGAAHGRHGLLLRGAARRVAGAWGEGVWVSVCRGLRCH